MTKPRRPFAPAAKSAAYFRVFSYAVSVSRERAFRRTYGPSGAWTRLFDKADGYLGTQLLARRDRDNEYLTIDAWTSEAAWLAFIASFGPQYRRLSGKYRRLYRTEREVGSFATFS